MYIEFLIHCKEDRLRQLQFLEIARGILHWQQILQLEQGRPQSQGLLGIGWLSCAILFFQ